MFNQDKTSVINTATNRVPQQPAMDFPFGQTNPMSATQDADQFYSDQTPPQDLNQPPNLTKQQDLGKQSEPRQQDLGKQSESRQQQQQQQQPQPQTATQNQRQPKLPTQYKPIPEELIVEWSAPNRPFKKRNRQFYSTVAIIVLLISLILFFAGQVLPIAVVISVAFMVYVLYSIPPGVANNKITTFGVRTDEMIYYWDELSRFWFEKQLDQDMLLFELNHFPWRVILLIKSDEKNNFRELLGEVLLEQKPPDTQIDTWANWLKEKLPLE